MLFIIFTISGNSLRISIRYNSLVKLNQEYNNIYKKSLSYINFHFKSQKLVLYALKIHQKMIVEIYNADMLFIIIVFHRGLTKVLSKL